MQIFLVDTSSLNLDDKAIKNYEALLSKEEKKRLNRTSALKAKTSFVVGRVLIKTTLAKILNCKSTDIILRATPKGRLELEFPISNLSFNLSHSNNLVVLGVSDMRIGIDIEFIKKRNFVEIAESFFTAEEFNLLKKANSLEEQQNLFYKYWTLKEAFIKCNGEQIFNKSSNGPDKNYQLASLQINQNYIMSIVVNKGNSSFQMPESFEVKRITNFQSSEILLYQFSSLEGNWYVENL